MTAAPTGLAVASLTPYRAGLKWTGLPPVSGSTVLTFDVVPTLTGQSGGPPTIVAYADPTGGTANAIQPEDLGDSSSAWFEFQVATGAGQIDFRYEVSSEGGFDKGYIALDGTNVVNGASGGAGWATASATVTAGNHTIRVTYNKDGSASQGFDNIRVGKITYPKASLPYEYRLDGGSIMTSFTQSVMLTGLVAGSTHLFEVRQDDGSGPSAFAPLTFTTTSITSSYGAAVLADSPAFYLELDETAGDFLDQTTNGVDWPYLGGVRGAAGLLPPSSASVQSAATGIARRPDVPAVLNATAFTFECWALIPPGNLSGAFFGSGNGNGWTVGIGQTTFDNTGRVLGVLANNVAWAMSSYSLPDTGVPQVFHLAWTFEGSGSWTIYVNGTAVATVSRTWNPATGYSTIGALMEANVLIRMIAAGVRMDALAIYPSALSGARVAAHYNAAFPMDGVQIAVPTVTPFATGAQLNWTATPGVSNYDYRIDGGAISSVAAPVLSLTGLTLGTTYNVEIRPKNVNGVGAWRSVSVTPAAAVVFDSFDRANVAPSASALGSSTDGKAWSQPSGTLGISSGMLYATTAAENLAVVAGTFDIDVTLVIPSPQNPTPDVSVLWRYRDTSNYWMLQYTNTGIILWRRQGGTFTSVASFNQTWALGRPSCVLRVLAVGTAQSFFIDGVLRFSMEDTASAPATDTSVGIRDANTVGRVDSIYAVTPTATSTPSYVYKGRDTKILDTVGAA